MLRGRPALRNDLVGIFVLEFFKGKPAQPGNADSFVEQFLRINFFQPCERAQMAFAAGLQREPVHRGDPAISLDQADDLDCESGTHAGESRGTVWPAFPLAW